MNNSEDRIFRIMFEGVVKDYVEGLEELAKNQRKLIWDEIKEVKNG